MLAGEPSLLEDIVDAVLRREEFKLLLQNQKEHTGVDHDGKSLFIIRLQVFSSCCLYYCFSRKWAVFTV